jgi:hypothetical protein
LALNSSDKAETDVLIFGIIVPGAVRRT